MKVCIPTLGEKGLEECVSDHFGRSPTFTIVDLDANKVKVIRNTSEHFGGMGHPPELLAREKVDVLLCSGLGPRAAQAFQQSGIEIYVGAMGTVKDVISAWQAGKLQEATDKNVCRIHRH